MIKFHGAPISGDAVEQSKFFQKRHALVSFANPLPLPLVAETADSFVLDNGAFPIWVRGGTLDYDACVRWMEPWARHPGFEWALIPDVIDGDELINDVYLLDFPAHIRGVPVWHLHESLDRLDRLVSTYETVAIGSSGEWRTPGTKEWWKRIAEAMTVICDENGRPRCRLHGLRQLNPAIFQFIPYTSADSANAGINAGSKKRFGMYLPPSASVRANVIADRIESYNSPAVWGGPPK